MSLALRFGTATGRGEGGYPVGGRQTSHLQTTLASSSAGVQSEVPVFPHHPITCSGTLNYEADGRFSCEHACAPPGDTRTQLCVDHSIAILLLELAQEL